ncbi:MAG: CinA family protein [Candidatus Omnitrophota bacterium]|nr:CinA family protein [Candidatus Omnitrophota bacterium]
MPIANRTARLLVRNKKTLAIAESCTGGLLSNLLTNLPGSSKFFRLSIIPYANQFKTILLKVSDKILKTKGAVSKETVLIMAKNIRSLAKTDFGLSVSGIAGPGGATKIKPVGLVYIGLSSGKKTTCKKFIFKGSRAQIKKQAANAALELLLKQLNNQRNHILKSV